jgi:hypothetical protein
MSVLVVIAMVAVFAATSLALVLRGEHTTTPLAVPGFVLPSIGASLLMAQHPVDRHGRAGIAADRERMLEPQDTLGAFIGDRDGFTGREDQRH